MDRTLRVLIHLIFDAMQKGWIDRAHDHFVLGPVSCGGPESGKTGRYRVRVFSIRSKLFPSILTLTFGYVPVPQNEEIVANRDFGFFARLHGKPLDCETVPPQLRA